MPKKISKRTVARKAAVPVRVLPDASVASAPGVNLEQTPHKDVRGNPLPPPERVIVKRPPVHDPCSLTGPGPEHSHSVGSKIPRE